MNNKTKLIVLNGLMIALVCIATMVIQIPIPMTEGYVNIGDSIEVSVGDDKLIFSEIKEREEVL